MHESVLVTTYMFVDRMSEDELLAISNALSFGFPIGPDTMGYEKCKGLLQNGKMHEETKNAFLHLAQQKLLGEK